jgi:hypothetical protein
MLPIIILLKCTDIRIRNESDERRKRPKGSLSWQLNVPKNFRDRFRLMRRGICSPKRCSIRLPGEGRSPMLLKFPRQETLSRSPFPMKSNSGEYVSMQSRCFIREKVSLGLYLYLLLNTHLVEEECLGMTYLADPLCDDVNATLPLEVHTISFNSDYYTTTQGQIDAPRTKATG